jgi:outer membrane protein assembly factor BamB
MAYRTFASFALITTLLSSSQAADWPQWRGPDRDGVWKETGILSRFPAAGLTVKWRVPVALGYAGPAVAQGRVYVMDYLRQSGEISNTPAKRDLLMGRERVLCFAADSGRLLWKHEYERPYQLSYPGGPRCTPSVADGHVYTLGAEGNLVCLDSRNGEVVWAKDLKQAYGAKTPQWGFAAHPLVLGKRLYCLVGGEGSVAVAFNKETGEEIWRALSASDQGYCPPTMIEHGGVEQLIVWHPESVNSLNPANGECYWSLPIKPDFGMSIAAPQKLGSHLFVCGYRNTAALVKLQDDETAAEIVWRGTPKTALYCSTSTPFLEAGTIYGNDGTSGELVAARLKDGERLWQTAKPTTGGEGVGTATVFLVKHQDRFFLFTETGDLVLAKLTPQRYEELGRFHVLEPTSLTENRLVVWSHPAFAERCLFARNDKELVCVSLSASD